MRFRARPAAFAIGATAAGLACVWLAYLFLRFGPLEVLPSIWADYGGWGLDLRAYVEAAGHVVREGSPYAPESIASSFEPGPAGLYYYSPVLAVALVPAVDVPWETSSTIWFAFHVLALAAACALMPVSRLTRVFAFCIAAFTLPVFKDSVYGNVSTLLVLPAVMGWRWIDRPIGSAAIAVSTAVRPSMGLLLIWQLLRRRWRAASWTIGFGVLLVAMTLPWVGIEGHRDYLDVLRNLGVPSNGSSTGGFENRDLGGIAMSFGAGAGTTAILRLASVVIAFGAMLLSVRRGREVSYVITLTASLLAMPLLWDHYLAMLVVPAAFLADRWRPFAILLPLCAWLPAISAFAVMLTLGLLFATDRRSPREPASAS